MEVAQNDAEVQHQQAVVDTEQEEYMARQPQQSGHGNTHQASTEHDKKQDTGAGTGAGDGDEGDLIDTLLQ